MLDSRNVLFQLCAAFGDLFIMVVIGFAFTICFEMPLVKFVTMVLRGGNGTAEI